MLQILQLPKFEQMIIFLHNEKYSITCQGYSPISVSIPPTILVEVKVLGTPHARKIDNLYNNKKCTLYLQQDPTALLGLTVIVGVATPGQEDSSQYSQVPP